MKKLEVRFEEIITVQNLLHAWQEFLCGKRHREDVVAFQAQLMDNILQLYQELVGKTYRHGTYHHFTINDPKRRDIHKASVRDRLVHHLLYRALSAYFDAKFIHDSYSCRDAKGTHKALNRFRAFARGVSNNHTKTCWVLKCDIKKFFATIDHSILGFMLKKHITNKNLVLLLDEVISSFHNQNKGIGFPLGNLTSQILVNIYMNEFDQFVKRKLKAKYYIRYADDFVILSYDREWLAEILPRAAVFLRENLHLQLHPDKVSISTVASGVDFLGWVHFPDHRVLRTATKRRMFARLCEGRSEEAMTSFRGLLSHGNAQKLAAKIDAIWE